MIPSDKIIDFIKHQEGCRLTSYKDAAGVYTIGYGTIMYRNGDRVKAGQTITMEQALGLLHWQVTLKALAVNKLLGNYRVTQSQFDALTSFAYNEGVGALENSTLLRKVKLKPSDPTIKDEFAKWTKAKVNGTYVILQGLADRRMAEWEIYNSKA
jgi:lysozyme